MEFDLDRKRIELFKNFLNELYKKVVLQPFSMKNIISPNTIKQILKKLEKQYPSNPIKRFYFKVKEELVKYNLFKQKLLAY